MTNNELIGRAEAWLTWYANIYPLIAHEKTTLDEGANILAQMIKVIRPDIEAVERVAKAIRHADEQDGVIRTPWEQLDKFNRRSYLDKAEAAIQAMQQGEVKS